MSGSNPFRPKKLEDLAKHSPSQTTPAPTISPDPIFLGPSSTAATSTSKPNLSSADDPSAGTTPPPPLDAPNLDDSVTSDNQSTSDPFDRDYDASDDEAERTQTSSETPTIASPGDLPLPQETVQLTPPSTSSFASHTTTTRSGEQAARKIDGKHIDENERLRNRTTSAGSFISDHLSTSSDATDSDSAVEEPQSQPPTKTARRPVSLGPGVDLRSLNNRLTNRDRIPPPPPKSHHGKRISPGPSIVLPPSQMTPGKAANRVSFHGSSSGSLESPRILQTDQDYFSTLSQTNQSAPLADVPRRSQSQNKRPPTPPLSRRHSQMRRSKSTLTKPTSSRLSIPLAEVEAAASTPSSPGSRPLTPLRSRDTHDDASYIDETQPVSSLRPENIAPTQSAPPKEIGLGIQSSFHTTSKRASLTNYLPPPPPPRRTRGSKHGDDSKDSRVTASLRSGQRAEGSENFVPHPSNAKDILADLTRLQKEVDDLRGHYQNQKS